ncbi:MAG: flippase-like domain-containing protein, partial [Coriobacteriia bacterium]|nr:flippase-like domain-containing protein [Coriobacteriia bacterium]
WLRVAVAVGLVWLLASRAGLGDLAAQPWDLGWWAIAVGVAVVPLSVAVRAFNHTLLANMRVRVLEPWSAFRLALVGAGIALFLPTGAADAAKAHYGYRVYGHAEDMIVSSALDKLTSLTAVAAMGAMGGLVAREFVLAGVAAGVGVLTVVPFAAPRVVPWRLALRVLAPGSNPDDDVIASVSRPPGTRLALVYAVSAIGWLLTYAVVYLACVAVGAQIAPSYILMLAPFTTLARMVPVSAGGIGLGEFTTAALLVRGGVEADLAARTALIAMVLLVLLPGAVGALLLAGGRHQRTSAISQGNEETTSTSV